MGFGVRILTISTLAVVVGCNTPGRMIRKASGGQVVRSRFQDASPPSWPWKASSSDAAERMYLAALSGDASPLENGWDSLSPQERLRVAPVIPMVPRIFSDHFLEKVASWEPAKHWAAEAMALRAGSPEPLTQCSKAGNPDCLKALARFPGKDAVFAVEDLLECFKSGRRPVPSGLAAAFVSLYLQGRYSKESTVKALETILSDRSLPTEPRVSAARLLRKFSGPKVLSFMAHYRHDPNRTVARAVRRSMYLMGR